MNLHSSSTFIINIFSLLPFILTGTIQDESEDCKVYYSIVEDSQANECCKLNYCDDRGRILTLQL